MIDLREFELFKVGGRPHISIPYEHIDKYSMLKIDDVILHGDSRYEILEIHVNKTLMSKPTIKQLAFVLKKMAYDNV